MHRHAHRAVEQRRGDPAVHGAQWVVVALARVELETCLAAAELDQRESEQFGDRGVRDLRHATASAGAGARAGARSGPTASIAMPAPSAARISTRQTGLKAS